MSAGARERIEELLADRALVGLSDTEERELADLLTVTGAEPDPGPELAAAALDRALAPVDAGLPAALRERLGAAAREFGAASTAARRAQAATATPARNRLLAWAGWVVAAAACLVAVLTLRARPVAPDPEAQRDELLARSDTLRLDWTATELAGGASGDVAWSLALQQGVLRIRDLAANDPAREQYQLWIFDESQEHPIDGGVFDVTAGEVLIPIDAKLRVAKPTLFAVTREKPGGVVVSDQKRIVLVAKI
jgi:anti-sigma-K factor RskA